LPAGRVPISDAVFSPNGAKAAIQVARASQDRRFTTGWPSPPADLMVLHLHTGSLDIVPGIELPPLTRAGSVVYAVVFVIYLARLNQLLRAGTDRPQFLGSWVLAGGVLFVALHAVSDIGITGLLGAKLATFGSQHDPGTSYTLYLVTYAWTAWGTCSAACLPSRQACW
jgi:hypothetical protein